MGEIRIIDRVFAFGAHVGYIKTEGSYIRFEGFLQVKTAMIGTERDNFTGSRSQWQGLFEPGLGRFRFFEAVLARP